MQTHVLISDVAHDDTERAQCTHISTTAHHCSLRADKAISMDATGTESLLKLKPGHANAQLLLKTSRNSWGTFSIQ